MSIDQANAFIEKMKNDENYKKDIMSIKDVDVRIQRINDDGFNCTKDDIIALLFISKKRFSGK